MCKICLLVVWVVWEGYRQFGSELVESAQAVQSRLMEQVVVVMERQGAEEVHVPGPCLGWRHPNYALVKGDPLAWLSVVLHWRSVGKRSTLQW